jgi:hypothetical protein
MTTRGFESNSNDAWGLAVIEAGPMNTWLVGENHGSQRLGRTTELGPRDSWDRIVPARDVLIRLRLSVAKVIKAIDCI